MLSSISITGPIAWSLLAAPVALLLLAAALALLKRAGAHKTALGMIPRGALKDSKQQQQEMPDTMDANAKPAKQVHDDATSIPSPEPETSDDALSRLVHFPRKQAGAIRTARIDDADVAKTRRKIATMKRAGKHNDELAQLCLQAGEHLCANGSRTKGLDHIRQTIELAISSKNARLQVQARMALAELAVDDGDIAGACEQWQMARELLTNAGDKEDGDKVSSHMHRCGCPTEWVLTDF